MQKIEIYCMNCKEFVLESNTEVLKSPMEGYMFKARAHREWHIFTSDAKGHDLVCPMCSWCFHLNGTIMVRQNGAIITGEPERIVSFLTRPTPQQKSIEKYQKQFKVKRADELMPSKKKTEPKQKTKKKDKALAKMGLE